MLLPYSQAEQIWALADSRIRLQAAQVLSRPLAWSNLGYDGTYLWGEILGRPSVRVALDPHLIPYSSKGIACTCSIKKLCEHGLALMLLALEHFDQFEFSEQLPFAQERMFQDFIAPPKETPRDIQRGMDQLEHWLQNLLGQGLSERYIRKFEFWDAIADRMLVAGMPSLSQWLRDLANLPVKGRAWTEPLLDELGLLFLLTQSFKRFDDLSFETQADLREAVGWRLGLDEFEADTSVLSEWLVIGKRVRQLRNGLPEGFIWLFNLETGQVALLHQLEKTEFSMVPAWEVGQVVNAALIFLPSQSPLKAILARHGEVIPKNHSVRGATISEVIADFGRGLGKNPWLKYFPVWLEEVYITRFNKFWIMRHTDGTYLPLAPHFKHKWQIHAFSAGLPMQVGGIWDGRYLYPISVAREGRFLDLNNVIPYR